MPARTIAVPLLLLAATAAPPAMAQGASRDWQRCEDMHGVYSPEEQVAACTALIESMAETRANQATAYYNRGTLFYRRQEFALALEDFARSLDLDPGQPLTWYNRALAHYALANYAAARADLDRAIALDPAHWESRQARGLTRLAQDDPAGARADLTEAIRLSPYTAGPYAAALYTLRGQAALAERDYDAAIGDFSFAIQTGVFEDAAHFGRATANFALKRWQLAYDDLNLFLERRADSRPAWTMRCLTGAALGHERLRVLGDCVHGVAMEPDSLGALEGLGIADLRYGEWQEALDLYQDALAQYPDRANLLYGRGVARARLGMTDEGWADIARASGMNPGVALDFADFGVAP
jgi:tetratricopeptide (TPR) repeat protein